MRIQLERLAADRQFLNSPGSSTNGPNNLTTLEHREVEFGGGDARKLLTSQTIDKHSTTNSSHLPQLQSRYSNNSRHDESKNVTMSINQNIILRRLDMIERMKADNKDRLERKLRELDKGNRTAI